MNPPDGLMSDGLGGLVPCYGLGPKYDVSQHHGSKHGTYISFRCSLARLHGESHNIMALNMASYQCLQIVWQGIQALGMVNFTTSWL